jgi:hypothetical protein
MFASMGRFNHPPLGWFLYLCSCFYGGGETSPLCFQRGGIAPKEDGKANHPSEGQETRLWSRARWDEFS